MNGSNGWDRTGEAVRGYYIGEYYCEGVVQSSRVKYGGKVQHTVKLTKPLLVSQFSEYEEGECILLDDDDVIIESVQY